MEMERLFDVFMKLFGALYFSVLLGWFIKSLISGFIFGRIERKEFKERKKTWSSELSKNGSKESDLSPKVDDCCKNVVPDPL